MKTIHELLTRSSEPEIIEDEIYNRVIDAVKTNMIGTQLLALRLGPNDIPGDQISIPLQTKNSMLVHEVAEGTEIPIDVEGYTEFNLKPVKFGIRPMITREMMEDSKFAVMQRNIDEAGYQMGRKLDSLILAQIKTGADANTVAHAVTGATAITVQNITDAMEFLELDDHTPTDLILSAGAANDIRNIDTFVEADKAGITNPSQSLIGTIYGMKVWVSNAVTANYAFIIDRRHALCLAEKRPITIKRYSEEWKDMVGFAITARWKERYLRAEACAYISI